MTLLFYISQIGGGGAARVMTNLANHFVTHNNIVHFVTNFPAKQEYYLEKDIIRTQLEFEELKTNTIFKNIRRVLALRKLIKKVKPDIVISFMSENNFRAVVANLGCNSKLLLSVRNDPDKEYRGWLKKFLGNIFFRLADGVVFQTTEAMQWFPKAVQVKSRIIPNLVNKKFFDSIYKGERTGIVTAGSLTKKKNHALLIKAFFRVKDICNDNLIIYGSGLKTQDIQNELLELSHSLGIEQRVIFMGETANLEKVMVSAKIFVLSSDYEGMPNALMEAMALGLPCISTDCPCGGPKMLFGKDHAGVLVPVGDEVKLANALRTLLSDPDELNEMSIKARLRAQDFLPEKVYAMWSAYIEDMIIGNNFIKVEKGYI